MPAPTYLTKDRHGGFLFRIAIPKGLRIHFGGKHSYRKSLQTRHRPTAIKRARRLAVFMEGHFTMAKRKYKAEKYSALASLFETEQYSEVLAETLYESLSEILTAEQLGNPAAIVSNDIARGLIEEAVGLMSVLEKSTEDAKQSLEDAELKLHFAEKIEGKQRVDDIAQIVANDYGVSANSIIGHASHSAALSTKNEPSIDISKAMDMFVESKRLEGVGHAALDKGPQSFRWGGYTRALKLFFAITGDKPASEINTDDLNSYKQIVPQLPASNTSVAKQLLQYDYQNLNFLTPIDEIVAESDKHDLNRLGQDTIADYYTHIVTFTRWLCRENDYLSVEVSEKASAILTAKKVPNTGKNKKADNYDEFSISQLNEIFGLPQFDTKKEIQQSTKPKQISPADFWIPLLALFTGARGRELAQLYTTDVVTKDGVWCLNIDDDDNKQIKGEASIRVTPIHEKLIEIGFLDFYTEQQGKGEGYLFPELRRHATGKKNPYKKWGDAFRTQVLKRHVTSEPGHEKLVFHSFRSTFISELRRQGVDGETRREIVGHAKSRDSHDQRYVKDLSANQLRDEINRAVYTGLDLSRASWEQFKESRLGK